MIDKTGLKILPLVDCKIPNHVYETHEKIKFMFIDMKSKNSIAMTSMRQYEDWLLNLKKMTTSYQNTFDILLGKEKKEPKPSLQEEFAREFLKAECIRKLVDYYNALSFVERLQTIMIEILSR